ncbi:MAG: efflux RND transporter permease subunit [Acidimicrobiia bacterium]|nr:efflux RND transporter permease subunit [Acidimicrobiia bacterium]
MQKVVAFALRQPLFFLLVTVIFIVAGVAAFRTLPIEAFPDVTDVQVTVITLYTGQAPEEVERQVTIPLEIGLSGIPNAVRLFAHTQFGLSFLIITFDDGTDDYFARQQVIERLRTVELPEGAEPQLVPLSTPIGEIYRYRIRGEGRSLMELRSIQDWVISRQLRMVPGVAEVVTRGGFVKQYEVQLDLAKARSYDVPMKRIFEALERGNLNTGGSYVERGEQQYLIRGLGMINSVRDIEHTVVEARKGTPILIRDLATVDFGALPRQGSAGMDDDSEIVVGLVSMRKGTNPTEVLNAIKERVRVLNESILPKDVKIDAFYDRQWLIDTTLNTVSHNLMIGALLVGSVLYVFLGNLRLAAIVTLIIPLAMLGTFIGLKLRGISANLLSLGALDFGILVDGGVIVAENIYRRLSAKHERHTPDSLRAAILEATAQVGRPTFFSMLIIIVAHIPIFTLQRHEGRIFEPMAYTVVSALVGSLLFSLTLIPLLSFLLLRKGVGEHDTIVVRLLQRVYRPALSAVLRVPKTVAFVALAAFAASMAVFPKLGTEFLPELDEGNIWVGAVLDPSVSLTQSQKICTQVRQILRRSPEVKFVYSQSGRPDDGTDPKMTSMIEFLVELKDRKDWRGGLTKRQLIEEMDQAVQSTIPGLKANFSQYIRDNVLESISQIDGQVVVKIFGQDMKVLREKATAVLQRVSKVDGVAYAAVDRSGTVPQLQIRVDREKAARFGLAVNDIQDVIEMGLRGKAATEVWEGESRFELVVRLKEEQRKDADAIRSILVDTPDGNHVPLSQVAEIAVRDGSVNISRENGSRVVAVSVFIRGRDMGSVVADMQQGVNSVQMPYGYRVEWSGEFENQQRAMSRLAIIVPATVFLIFLLLFDTFKSVKDAVLILLNVPFALIGGILALFLTSTPLSVSAAIGFIALFGVAVLNGVVMISYFHQLRATGMPARQAALEGSVVRLRSVSMTAVLAILGFLPISLSSGIGSEVQKPLAMVVIGGLVSATTLTLFLLPALYLLFPGRALDEDPGAVQGHEHGI